MRALPIHVKQLWNNNQVLATTAKGRPPDFVRSTLICFRRCELKWIAREVDIPVAGRWTNYMCLHFPGLPPPLAYWSSSCSCHQQSGPLIFQLQQRASGDSQRMCCKFRDGSLSKFAAERIIRSRPGSEPLPLHCTTHAACTALHVGRSEPLPLALHCTYCNRTWEAYITSRRLFVYNCPVSPIYICSGIL